MATVIQVLGPHAHCLRKYGVNPEGEASTAVDKLNAEAAPSGAPQRDSADRLIAVRRHQF